MVINERSPAYQDNFLSRIGVKDWSLAASMRVEHTEEFGKPTVEGVSASHGSLMEKNHGDSFSRPRCVEFTTHGEENNNTVKPTTRLVRGGQNITDTPCQSHRVLAVDSQVVAALPADIKARIAGSLGLNDLSYVKWFSNGVLSTVPLEYVLTALGDVYDLSLVDRRINLPGVREYTHRWKNLTLGHLFALVVRCEIRSLNSADPGQESLQIQRIFNSIYSALYSKGRLTDFEVILYESSTTIAKAWFHLTRDNRDGL